MCQIRFSNSIIFDFFSKTCLSSIPEVFLSKINYNSKWGFYSTRSSVVLLSIYEAYLWFLPSLNITFDFNKVKTDVRTKRWFNVDSIILIENKATCTLFVNENNVRKVFRHLWISSNITTTSHTKVIQESRDKIGLLLKHNPQIYIAIFTVGLQPLAWKHHDYV